MNTTTHPPGAPTGVGIRIRQRRQALGLSTADVAERTGLGTDRIERLESGPFALTGLELVQLARALELTVSELVGRHRPVAPAAAPLAPDLQPMRKPECVELLRTGQIGRLAYNGADGLVVFPVNYRWIGDVIVFRTAADSGVAQYDLEPVAFELDFLDEGMHDGWSVLVNGVVRPAEDGERAAAGAVEPWAGGTRQACMTVEPRRITGRRIRSW
ncbi:helix-turn-helix domain-containing protein [Kribbella sp. NPDC020789]